MLTRKPPRSGSVFWWLACVACSTETRHAQPADGTASTTVSTPASSEVRSTTPTSSIDTAETVPDADASASPIVFERQMLTDDYVAEGATFGDFNHDGNTDIAAGSHWYAGPQFEQRHEFRAALVFDPLDYTDTFFAFSYDFNGDGWDDLLTYGFPGEQAWWYQNPQGQDGLWPAYEAFPSVDNESAAFANLIGGPEPEMVFMTNGSLGWATPTSELPTEPFSFQTAAENADWQRFTHGLGLGDVDLDGRADLLLSSGIWFQPEAADAAQAWSFEAHNFGTGGAQMFAYDVDGDNDQDVITSLEAHGYGLAWFEQIQEVDGSPAARFFVPHVIAGSPDDPGPTGVVLHEPHALTLVDVDGDGLLDIVTGERFWGHVPPEPDFDAPALVVWFRLTRPQSGVSYEAHIIDAASGVGTQVTAQRFSEDKHPHVLTANKKGVFVFHTNEH